MSNHKHNGVSAGTSKTLMPDAAIERALAIAEAERLEKLPPHERVKEEAKKRQNISDSLMRVNFPSLRAIKHVKGVILVVADDAAALKQAIKEAEVALGPKASYEQVLDYAEKHRVKTTLMSVKTFRRNLMNTLRLCNGHAEMFGAGSGGGQLKDIFQEGAAAIQEAEKYWTGQNRILTTEIKEFMNAGSATDERTFEILLGKNWKLDNTLDPDTKKLLGLG